MAPGLQLRGTQVPGVSRASCQGWRGGRADEQESAVPNRWPCRWEEMPASAGTPEAAFEAHSPLHRGRGRPPACQVWPLCFRSGQPRCPEQNPSPTAPSLCGSHHQKTQRQTQFTAAAEAGVPTGCLVTATLAPSCSHSLRPTSTSGSSSMVPGGVLFPWGLGAQPGQWTPADRGQPGNGSMTWGPRQPGVPLLRAPAISK